MKVCAICGEEISTKDGDNLCPSCDKAVAIAHGKTLRKARAARKEREQILKDLGLVKVRGALGGTYWE